MPPRYAYWTIIVDDQPTAFRAGALEDIMPTFNRLKEKQPTAKLMWFQSGKLWPSRIDAREAMQVRGERGRYSDPRQDGGDKTPSRERPKWKSKDFSAKPRAAAPERTERPQWKPRSSSPQAPKPSSPERSTKPEWKPRGASGDRTPWKPKGGDRPATFKPSSPERREKPEWKPKNTGDRPEWKPRGSSSPPSFAKASTSAKATADKSEGKLARGPSSPRDEAKRKWIPKAEYKKLTGTEAKRDDKWRPGGEHQDPRQKYKDAKKAKWGRFKQAIRSRAKKKS